MSAPVADAPAAEIVYKIISSDGVVSKMSEKAVQQSKTLSNLIENLGYTIENIETRDPIPVTNVNGKTMAKVAELCEKHKADAIPEDNMNVLKTLTIPEWDQKFLKIEDEALFDLILASNFLDIKGLMYYGCKTVSNMAKGKTTAELREIFGINTDEQDAAEETAQKAAAEVA
ncbi:Skp1-related protein [Caenorhabditis elegans]|uniref:Skp1-related protein n=1 Tax=Caenorhabditis elegans TaxID=6239 RepID=G5EEX4_CAEEL|nr:Skp1-related protein [Caenorhabditis elegans]AAL34102.1 SKR-13 [Caenorhabditis elegans]CAM36326.1 Skp1-related protein [Caenorhabditis elegans]|eukprot:NP_503042.1 SKp1 Related (ubiquitin ligase complex component) [Caenorhabditis elegans]